jgi:ABC-type phosphate/phosphonate transport system substrate-binding protein
MITFLIFLGYFMAILGMAVVWNKKNTNDVEKDIKHFDKRFVPIQKYNKLKERLELVDQYLRKNRNFSINEIEELNKRGKL